MPLTGRPRAVTTSTTAAGPWSGRRPPRVLGDLDIDDSSLAALDASSTIQVGVDLEEAPLDAELGDEEAGAVDHLVMIDRAPAALVLPITDVDDDVHDANP